MKSLINGKNKFLWAGLLLLFIAMAADSLFFPLIKDRYINRKVEGVQRALNTREAEADKLLIQLRDTMPEEIFNNAEYYIKLSKEKHIFLYVYSHNQLIFWTDNSVFPTALHPDKKDIIQELPNGIYLQKSISNGELDYIALIPIKYQFSLQNQYLHNKFALINCEKTDFNIFKKDIKGSFPLYSRNNEYLCSLKAYTVANSFDWIAWVFLAGLTLIFIFLHITIESNIFRQRKLKALLIYLAASAIFIFIWKFYRRPEALFNWPLFSPKLFASSVIFPSLGDLLLFTGFLSWTIWILTRFRISYLPLSHKAKIFVLAVFMIVIFFFGSMIETAAQSLIFDSSISFDPGNIFSLGRYSFIGFFIVFGLIIGFLLLSRRFIKRIKATFPHKDNALYFFVICISIAVILLWLSNRFHWAAFGFTLLTLGGLYFSAAKERVKAGRTVFYLLLISTLFTSYIFSEYNELKQRERQRVLASRLVSERDPVAEYLFADIYRSIRNDNYVQNYFFNPITAQGFLKKRIEHVYFSGYLSKYDLEIYSYTLNGAPFKGNYDKPLDFFKDLLATGDVAMARAGGNLFFINTYSGLPAYISEIEIERDGLQIGTLVLVFQQKAFYEESIYPELLLSEELQRYETMDQFSYAIYSNNRLVTQQGEYAYPEIINATLKSDTAFKFVKKKGFNHLVHKLAPGQLVVVSKKINTLLYYFASFFFFLFFFSVACVISYLIYLFYGYVFSVPSSRQVLYGKLRSLSWRNISFRTKVLVSINISIILALLLIGFVTIKYITYRYNKDELGKLRTTTRSITSRLEEQLRNSQLPAPAADDELIELVKTLSGTYQMDINIFDVDGNLLVSSQPAIYERGIIQRKINPSAYQQLVGNYESEVVQEENIGSLNYTSSYMPVRNAANQISGFLNLPFFSKERELNDEISSFLLALINLYMLLFLVLLTLSFIISNALTAPLNIIREHLRNTRLTSGNELISWKNNDEIGKLIGEYNHMVLELEESAQRLAESEREGAWKEMARQVAHEIKNPLTPMKLNIQQLQRAWQENSERLPQLFEKVTSLLIRQIDTLSQIATEFSNFAKMPHNNPVKLDINVAVQQSSDLFQNEKEAEITTFLYPEPLYAFVDPNQFSRVMNNLIKNAIQAIPENKKGLITLITTKDENNDKNIKIEVRDNGTGIPEELKNKIFIPNFSTKSSGMGLGLAIVKNIIQDSGGRIWFETSPGEGTSFFITLPVFSAENMVG